MFNWGVSVAASPWTFRGAVVGLNKQPRLPFLTSKWMGGTWGFVVGIPLRS